MAKNTSSTANPKKTNGAAASTARRTWAPGDDRKTPPFNLMKLIDNALQEAACVACSLWATGDEVDRKGVKPLLDALHEIEQVTIYTTPDGRAGILPTAAVPKMDAYYAKKRHSTKRVATTAPKARTARPSKHANKRAA